MGLINYFVHVTNLRDSFGKGSHTLHIYIIFHGSEKKPNKHFSLKVRNGKLLNRVMKKSLWCMPGEDTSVFISQDKIWLSQD